MDKKDLAEMFVACFRQPIDGENVKTMNCDEYAEAHRLLKFLRYFIPISDKEIPPTSIMRE
ncbi:hypothetical protein, partial [Prevotella sp. P6B4]|uniref:hypothetical protein n=1 Tax=Prevotella sp. P6B4 TaxID=1410614 RepID=UPI000561B8A1